ncbi:hypothetical protein GXM_00591 [Nostoc sphaeroides CCNUC1]|uniref:Uncharacterized protein n=1 Tax=Nostoc sphaeroides CCNUC1 TaxID=2653204 RepID=A0A5P8VRP5_9NOSO|nr:hypothetical protein GXM_00591 [Nostoc sphaeroides CCNUC1]
MNSSLLQRVPDNKNSELEIKEEVIRQSSEFSINSGDWHFYFP